ncbi:hypothetical protein [Candidatus Contubernalis alkaliaceticus]|uniref:hypothetical protein n=1 Tax=Candidatus Contubernalis alkaliaceticus TaxID=338645 RepID=UPI001F4C1705|nr:hypothetical protein [Candidatus Contubernalis alkalaceticus]UNC91051.1 hypothetical protein HUE98_02495 [Candidatus Contubernalis alkalaceticus]
MLTFVLVNSIYAANATVNIKKGQGPVQSASITANNGAKYSGRNYSSSEHSLYIDLQASSGSGWANVKTSLMAIGSSASGLSTMSGALLWRVQLNPQYLFTDCNGEGTVSNR